MPVLLFGGEEPGYEESHKPGVESLIAVYEDHAAAIKDGENRWAKHQIDWYQVVTIDGTSWTTITEEKASEEAEDRRKRRHYPQFQSTWDIWKAGWCTIGMYHHLNKRPWQEVAAVVDGKAWMSKRLKEYTTQILATFQDKLYHHDVLQASMVGAISLRNMQILSQLPVERQPDYLELAMTQGEAGLKERL